MVQNRQQQQGVPDSQVSAELVVAAALGEVCFGGELVRLVQQILGHQIPQEQVQCCRLPDLVVPMPSSHSSIIVAVTEKTKGGGRNMNECS